MGIDRQSPVPATVRIERMGRRRSVAISHQPGGLPAGVFQLHFVERVSGISAYPYQDRFPAAGSVTRPQKCSRVFCCSPDFLLQPGFLLQR